MCWFFPIIFIYISSENMISTYVKVVSMSLIFGFTTGCDDFICAWFCGSSSVIISRIDSELDCPLPPVDFGNSWDTFEFLEG